MRNLKRRTWHWLGPVLFFFLLLLALQPPFFTFDTYDYLSLTLNPMVGAAHSLGFPLVLRLIAFVSDIFSHQFFKPLLLLWNAVGAGLLVSLVVPALLRLRSVHLSSARRIVTISLVSIFILFILPAILFMTNAFWSEGTNFLHIALFALILKHYAKLRLPLVAVCSFLLAGWAYHTRYSEVVLPVCFLATAVTFFCRHNISQVKRCLVIFLFSTLGVVSSTRILKMVFPTHEGQQYITNLVLTASIQCALRCDVSLYENSCSTPAGKELIESFKCSELIFSLKPFGKPVLGHWATLPELASHIGFKNFLKWVVLAPLKYLSDTHLTELGWFQFDGYKPASDTYPAAVEFYKKYLASDKMDEISSSFSWLADAMDFLFSSVRLFHGLTIFVVLISIFTIFRSRDEVTVLLSFAAVGTYLLFSYLNPHVPLRYLIMIILPGLLAGILHLASDDPETR